MYAVSDKKVVVFDSAPEDHDYNDRVILWWWDGEYQLDDWHQGRRYTKFLSLFEAVEFIDMVGMQ